jgi:MFS family permease
MKELLAHRDARLYLAGQALSVLGDNALWLAMGIWVKILTGSNSAAGFTFFAYVSGLLFAPLGGLVADRMRRRPLLVAANWGTGALVCVLLLATDRSLVWLIYLVMFGYGVAGGLVESAQSALLVVMLPESLLAEANSLLQVAQFGLRIVTPLLGAGLLAVVGPKPVIVLDAVTFVVAGLAVLALRLREDAPQRRAERWHSELTAGLRYMFHTAEIRRLWISLLAALLVFGFFQTVQFAVVAQGLHRTPPFVGVLESVTGAGAIVGGVVAAPILARISEHVLVRLALVVAGLVTPFLMFPWLQAVLVALPVVGACIVWVEVAATTLVQRRTPNELMGRVTAATTTMAMIPQAISIALGASLIAVLNYRILLIVISVAFLVSAALLAGYPRKEETVSQAMPDVETNVPQGRD